MEQAEEIKKMIEEASSGHWIPVTTIISVFGIVIMLLLYIWNQMLKSNELRHANHDIRNDKQDLILEEVKNNLHDLKIIVTRMEPKTK